jgi:hypothetical protein
MPVLTETQIKEGYFSDIGGFPPLNATNDRNNYTHEVKDYKGKDKLCIACTQLENCGYSEKESKRILNEWIDFLRTNTKALKALHFNSNVPQSLFDAACCQKNLEELRFKWGAYSDLSKLENLKKLKFLYIGSGSRVKDISALSHIRTLIALYVENFKKIEDYSPLADLEKLEQLVISGPTLGRTPMKDMEFLRKMPGLISVWLPNTTCKRKYTSAELKNLRESLPALHDVNGCIWSKINVE